MSIPFRHFSSPDQTLEDEYATEAHQMNAIQMQNDGIWLGPDAEGFPVHRGAWKLVFSCLEFERCTPSLAPDTTLLFPRLVSKPALCPLHDRSRLPALSFGVIAWKFFAEGLSVSITLRICTSTLLFALGNLLPTTGCSTFTLR
jgi:hypothetical protein